MNRAALVVLLLAGLAAGSSPAAAPVTWESLRRPLRIPVLEPGAACPVSARNPRGSLGVIARGGGRLPAWGRGPAYPLLIGPAGPQQPQPLAVLQLPPPEGFGVDWGVTKAVWFTSRAYGGRILVRGRQLDGPNEVRFEDGQPGFTPHGRLNPVHELRLQGDATGHASTTRLRAPGCYAYQLDGATFSRLIVFRAVLEP